MKDGSIALRCRDVQVVLFAVNVAGNMDLREEFSFNI